MGESPQRIWIEADDECPYFYEAHGLHDVEQDVIEYVRADLYAALEAQLAERAGGSFPKPDTVSMSEGAIHLDYEVDEARSAAYEWLEAYAYSPALSPAPEAQQEPVAWTREEMLPLEHRFMFLEVAKEGSAVSCTPLFTRPAEQAVTEAMVEAGAKAIVACRFEDESEPVTDYDLELSRAALKAAMEAGR